MVKDFDSWNKTKQNLDAKESLPTFAEREVWWCSVGANIGFEIFGKSKVFTRPVLVVRKFGPSTFLGVPLTTSKKKGYYRVPYKLQDKDGFLLLDQIRAYDARRLVNQEYIQKMHTTEFKKLKQAIKTCFNL